MSLPSCCAHWPLTGRRSSVGCSSPRRSWDRRRSTRPMRAISGTWSTARTGRSASRCSAACRRAPTPMAGSHRWRMTPLTSGGGCCPGSTVADADRSVDYVVVGLGALGSAAAWHLAARGASVLGLEQFELGHARGASHDTSRILRHSYHTPAYVRLTQEAYDDWARLEEASGETLVTVVGGLDLFPPGCMIAPEDYVVSLREVGIGFESLSS